MKKKIVVNNRNDYNRFVKKLFIYKSILYKNVFFELENIVEDENLDYLIKGLNIKNRKKRIDFIYDMCCFMIDSKNSSTNICGFINNQCFVQRKNKDKKCNGCCRKCIYQTSKGCSSKNLACKLFNCSEVKKRFETLSDKDLILLKLLSLKNRFIVKSNYFSLREDVLKDLYCYSFIVSTIRIIFRLIKNIFLNGR